MLSKCGRPFALQLHYSLAAVAVALVGSLLGAVPVEGRDCKVGDVFKNGKFIGNDYTTASIPSDCTTLDLDTSSIGDSGATAIAAALKGNTELATLYLQSNNIGDSGATALAEALKVNAALTGLSLSTNDIGADGATAIAGALKANAALTALGLYDNKIGDSGATAIAEALKGNAALTYLDLSSNTIGDGGATAIAEALKVNAALTTLYLHNNNNINDRALTDAIAASLAENYNPITRAAKLTKAAELKDPSLRVAREAAEKIARAAGVAALAAANPCGAHSGCEKCLATSYLLSLLSST